MRRQFGSTDDAFIAARQFAIAPKVAGYITAVPVTDNEHVPAGAVIARIDDRDSRAALAQADAQVTAAQAGIANIVAQTNVQQAQVEQAKAQVEQAQANLNFAEQQAARYTFLARDGSGSVQNAQQYASQDCASSRPRRRRRRQRLRPPNASLPRWRRSASVPGEPGAGTGRA